MTLFWNVLTAAIGILVGRPLNGLLIRLATFKRERTGTLEKGGTLQGQYSNLFAERQKGNHHRDVVMEGRRGKEVQGTASIRTSEISSSSSSLVHFSSTDFPILSLFHFCA